MALLLLFRWISYIFLLIVSAYFVGLLLLLYYFTSCVQTGDEELQFSCLHMKVLHIFSDILEELRHPQVAAKCSVGLIIFLQCPVHGQGGTWKARTSQVASLGACDKYVNQTFAMDSTLQISVSTQSTTSYSHLQKCSQKKL